MTQTWAIGLVSIASIFGALGPIYFKKASTKPIKEFYKNNDLITGIAMYAMSTILFIPSLKGGELSVMYPLMSLIYVWTAILSKRYLGEKMNVYKWTGIILIITGVMSIGLGSQ